MAPPDLIASHDLVHTLALIRPTIPGSVEDQVIVVSIARFEPVKAVTDFTDGLGRWRLWSTLAWHDLILRYRRSWLGIGWILISFSLFIGAKITIFGVLSSEPLGYFAVYLSVGYLIYRFMTSIVTDGAAAYIAAEGWIKGEALPLSVYLYRAILRNAIVTACSSVPVIIICVIYAHAGLSFFLSLVPALLAYFANAVWVGALLSLLCTRYRDLSHLLGTSMSIIYFLTPVLWIPKDLGRLAVIADYNPFTHFIAILRTPLLDGTVPWTSWAVVGGMTVAGFAVTIPVYALFRRRIVYWL